MNSLSYPGLEALSIRPVSGAFRAVIEGLGVSNLDSEQIVAVRMLLDEYSVLVFSDQKLTPQDPIAFTANFGALERQLVSKTLY